nr:MULTISPECIES: PD-(D/E)XK nuclease family protein [unclassified Bradyrhizobium]
MARHDGLVASDHPAILAALARSQSTTSLQRLLRDPLGYVWRYALGWRSIRLEGEPLQLDPIAFGELVHELIAGAITRLEPRPGFARANADEIEAAIEAASSKVLASWPLQRSVPPAILWQHTVKEAARRTTKGLACDDPTRADTRSWSEVPFGQETLIGGDLPWDETVKVPIEQAGLVFGGRIDRLDIRASGEAEMHQNITVTVEPSAYLQAVVARAEAASRVQLNGQLGTGMQGPGDNSVKSTQGPPTGSQE